MGSSIPLATVLFSIAESAAPGDIAPLLTRAGSASIFPYPDVPELVFADYRPALQADSSGGAGTGGGGVVVAASAQVALLAYAEGGGELLNTAVLDGQDVTVPIQVSGRAAKQERRIMQC